MYKRRNFSHDRDIKFRCTLCFLEPSWSSIESSITETSMSDASTKENVPSARPLQEGSDLAPEGGTRGWLCVAGAFLSIFCTFGFLNAYVVAPNLLIDRS